MHYSSSDIRYWLAAHHLDGVGPIRLQRWLCQCDDIQDLFHLSTYQLQNLNMTVRQIHALQNPNWHAVKKDLDWGLKDQCHIIAYDSEKYPVLLKEISDPPAVLFVKGNVDLLNLPQLAVVGSRNPTLSGKEIAEQFAACLANAGLVITSGLALGIDTASHQGALNSKKPTIAVCGNGLDHIYPSSNKKLAIEIITHGALISELSPMAMPKAAHFPRRNRIISGMSLGVLVVEAAIRSGSLITAHFAVEYGREVFAIPGSLHNPLAKGCHQLIRNGAKLIETAEDILEDLGSMYRALSEEVVGHNRPQLDQPSERMLQQIGYEITPLDAIIMRSGMPAIDVTPILLSLELMGYVRIVPGGYVRNA